MVDLFQPPEVGNPIVATVDSAREAWLGIWQTRQKVTGARFFRHMYDMHAVWYCVWYVLLACVRRR